MEKNAIWFYILIICVFGISESWAEETPSNIYVNTVAKDIISLEIKSRQHVEYGHQIPYEKQDGDRIKESGINTLWHELFLDTTAFKKNGIETFVWQEHEQREAAWVYANTENTDPDIKENCTNALIKEADQRVEQCYKIGFQWTKYPWAPTGYGVLSAPDGVGLVRAHVLTGDDKYLKAAVLACQTGVGANPINICYTTGLGYRQPQHPLHIDSRITHQPPPPGITVLGPIDTKNKNQEWARMLVDKFCYPPVKEWPTIEAYWDVFWYPIICEFTVQNPMARNAYVWGYLAARQER